MNTGIMAPGYSGAEFLEIPKYAAKEDQTCKRLTFVSSI
jgi:hypothetical protein